MPATPVAFDMHLHTSRHSSDAKLNPFRLVRRARQLGLAGIVITEHDKLWTEEELAELRAATPGLLVLSGVEVSAKEGHFLAYGLSDGSKVPIGIGVKELCQEVHHQGGAVVAAHPYRWNQNFDEILEQVRPKLDGIEVMSSNMDDELRRRAATLMESRAWSGCGNSDAHEEGTIGVCYTQFPRRLRDQRDLVEALRTGQAAAYTREGEHVTVRFG
jgi:predicted metal-dependent phosphoesterase TrpH